MHGKLKALLEHSSHLKRLLFVMVLMGTSMVIGDGILTPAISGSLLESSVSYEVLPADLQEAYDHGLPWT